MRNRRLQGQVTAGRATLPIVILISILCWGLTTVFLPEYGEAKTINPKLWNTFRDSYLPEWIERMLSCTLYALIGYFLIELNNRFAIIRLRASVQTSIYFLFVTFCPGMHALNGGDLASAMLLLAIYFLFGSYHRQHASGALFRSFVCLGAGSIAFPQLLFLCPLWWVTAYQFQSLSSRSFFGSLLGVSLPYFLLLACGLLAGEMEVFTQPFVELATFSPFFHFGGLQLWEILTVGYLFILFVVSSVHCVVSSHEDRIQTRAYLLFLSNLSLWLFLLIALQPAQSQNLFPLLIISTSILTGHLFVLTHSKSSNAFFIGAMVGLILLFGFNIWTLL